MSIFLFHHRQQRILQWGMHPMLTMSFENKRYGTSGWLYESVLGCSGWLVGFWGRSWVYGKKSVHGLCQAWSKFLIGGIPCLLRPANRCNGQLRSVLAHFVGEFCFGGWTISCFLISGAAITVQLWQQHCNELLSYWDAFDCINWLHVTYFERRRSTFALLRREGCRREDFGVCVFAVTLWPVVTMSNDLETI